MDKAAEKCIVETLRSWFPDWNFLCEESGLSMSNEDSEYRWIVDPLDGTTSFTHGHPGFSTCIALEYRGLGIVLGVVYCPVYDEMYVASLNNGAFCNGKPIHVSKTDKLINALVSTGFPTNRVRAESRLHTNLPYFEAILMKCRDIRRNGSCALDLCFVAKGRQDAYWEWGLKAWDCASGNIILCEAGGKLTNLRGSDHDYEPAVADEKYHVLATNGLLHQSFLDTFKPINDEYDE